MAYKVLSRIQRQPILNKKAERSVYVSSQIHSSPEEAQIANTNYISCILFNYSIFDHNAAFSNFRDKPMFFRGSKGSGNYQK